MSISIQPNGVWYHGSPERFTVLRQGSTVTPCRTLAKAFSHRPSLLCWEDDGTITHSGGKPGFLYQVDESTTLGGDLLPHPRSTMEPNAEFLTQRPLAVKLIGIAPWPQGPLIRLADPEDAQELVRLNRLFNGPPGAPVEMARRFLAENTREIVLTAEKESGRLTEKSLAGFVCLQLKRSFCYELPTAEITEVFVEEGFRRRGLAGAMLRLGEEYVRANFQAEGLSLVTGSDNFPAQELYRSLGFVREDEILFSKSLRQELIP